MTEIAMRYRRLSGQFADRLAAVPHDGWERPTPCQGWHVRQLVQHVVETQSLFRGLVGWDPIPTPPVAEDPTGAWDAARAVMQADLDDPDRAGTTFDGLLGRSTFAEAVDRFLNFDLIIHGWDLARATGQDDRIPPEDIAHVQAQMAVLGDRLYTSGQFAPALEPPAGADAQTQLLARLGRRAWEAAPSR
ncbi:MAG TPA: TIGR03086 family metal-binding protein [Natronosporangium sp.]|nr:TIGR03086 family metal-binding protein [Natronosporangium sp.]